MCTASVYDPHANLDDEGLPQPSDKPSGKTGEKLQPSRSPEKTLQAPDGSLQPDKHVKGASAKSPGEPPDFSSVYDPRTDERMKSSWYEVHTSKLLAGYEYIYSEV